jgi:hypothetical protein
VKLVRVGEYKADIHNDKSSPVIAVRCSEWFGRGFPSL